MRNIDLIIKFLNEFSKMNEIEDIELINTHGDVYANIGLRIKSKDIRGRILEN